MKTTGKVTGIIANLITVEVNGPVAQNEICYIKEGNTRLMAEVIKVNGKNASVKVYESTRGVKKGNEVESKSDLDWKHNICHSYRMVWNNNLKLWNIIKGDKNGKSRTNRKSTGNRNSQSR